MLNCFYSLFARTFLYAMKFVHLIEINAVNNPLIPPLTREQLWHGLVIRAERPTLFQLGLDSCEIIERSTDHLARVLRFGQLVIHDSVRFEFMQQVLYHVPEQNEIPVSDLSMTIEEPQPGALFVRFEYDDHLPESEDSENAIYNDFRRSAYEESDIDTIRVIRQLADQGQLDAPLQ
jgi:hypothetical protein